MNCKPRVLLTEPVFPEVSELLEKHTKLDIGKRGAYNTEDSLCEVIGEYDGLLSMLSNPITPKVIDHAKKLKIVANHAVGYNNIDVEACKKAGIRVANTPDVLTDATADGTLALMLATVRHIPSSQEFLRRGDFDGWHPTSFLGPELKECTLGIIGMGRIGIAVAKRCRAFGMNILYHNRSRINRETEQELGATYTANLLQIAHECDIISLHCPLTDQTHHLVDKNFLDAMKPDAFLINAARGPVVDEAALARTLHAKQIAGAGIDVFEKEPEIHPDLLSAPNAVLIPHITSATYSTRKAMGMLAVGAILNELCGMDHSCNFVV